MKKEQFCWGLIVSCLLVASSLEAQPQGVTWGEWGFGQAVTGTGDIPADLSSHPQSLIRINAASSAVTVADGIVTFSQIGPDDYLRVDIEDLVENGGGYVNAYTMIFDLKATQADWLPVYNTGYDNYNAADFWVSADGAVGPGDYSDAGAVPLDTWVRLVVTRQQDGGSWVRDVYVNGTLVFDNAGSEGADGNSSLYTNAQQDEGQFTILSDSDATAYPGCELDSFAFIAASLSAQEIAELGAYRPGGIYAITGVASVPLPKNEAPDVSRDVTLSWTPSETARTHTVYLGTTWEDVNAASTAKPLDVLVSQGQTISTYQPDTVLGFGQTYYWRVDEVNGAPDHTVFPGDVWSFTVEPMAIPVANVTATASASSPGMGPEKTIDGSGLDELGQHSTGPLDMWFSEGGETTWIQFAFDKAYTLHEMWIWNSNQVIEAFIGFGVKGATIESSVDGENWTLVEGVGELAKAPGAPGYMANNVIAMGDIMAKYVRLTVASTHGVTGQSGLSEVRFMAIPVAPREPQPADGGTASGVDVELSWRSGREAVRHEVYFGPDADNMSLIDTTDAAMALTDTLDYQTSYAWSVTEVNDAANPSSRVGPVWTFTTAHYGVVDDFESYSGQEGEEVFIAWADGFGGDASLGGSTTGHIDGPFVETTIVNPGTEGNKSMPVYIDNDGNFFDIDGKVSSPNFSEVVRSIDTKDWTASGITTLSIMFAGSPDLTGQLYCKIGATKIAYDGDASDLGTETWQTWTIDLSTTGANLTNVRELALGVEGGTSGILYIDDIRLYPSL